VEESRLLIHDWPLFSREDSVKTRPVWTSQDESAWRWRREEERGWVGLRTCPKPWDVSAPEGAEGVCSVLVSSGRTMETLLLALRFSLVRLFARERMGEFVRMPPGEGRPEMWLMEAEVWSSEVVGSKYAE
jgi:hypothetical protein